MSFDLDFVAIFRFCNLIDLSLDYRPLYYDMFLIPLER